MIERVVDKFFTTWSFVIHTAWFAAWFLFGLDVALLTNVVSLEAIYLSIAIGVAQKGHHEKTRRHLMRHREGDT